jgi:hypothetical protein
VIGTYNTVPRLRPLVAHFVDETVGHEAVLQHWLRVELRKRGETLAVDAMDERELLAALMERTGGENRPLWRPRETAWLHGPVTERRLRRLRTVAAPDDLGWDRVAPDGSVLTAARRVRDGSVTDETTPLVDVDLIREIAAGLPDREVADLVLVTEQTTAPPRVVDGNHRAVGAALHLLWGGELPDLEAYVGVVETRPLRRLTAKLRWLARRRLRDERW